MTEINVAGSKLVTYNVHLESRGGDDLRLSQIEEVLSDAAWRDSQYPVIIAGDFNLDASKDATARAFLTAGFRDSIAAPRTSTTPSHRLFEPGRHIDWTFIRGQIRAESGQVHSRVKASDHYPISFTLTA